LPIPFPIAGLAVLILFKLSLRIATSPSAKRIISLQVQRFLPYQFASVRDETTMWIVCQSVGVMVLPADKFVSAAEMRSPTNAVAELLNRIEANREREYLVLLTQPGSSQYYWFVRREIDYRQIDVVADVLDDGQIRLANLSRGRQ
jgi:hypothetical protein